MSDYCTKAKCKARKKVIQMRLEVNRPWTHLRSLCCGRISSVALKALSGSSRGRWKEFPHAGVFSSARGIALSV